MRVSILICTRERPAELRRCCESLAGLKFRVHARPDLDVVVVDNTPGGTPGLDAASVERWTGCPSRLVVEPRTGISFARNTALDHRHPDADLVAFVDDDETVAPSWLDHLVAVAAGHDADIVAGPALARLPESAVPAVRALYIQRADRRRKPTGTEVTWAGAGNLLVRVALLERHPELRFDERLGLSGGEDSDWTTRAHDLGARLVWADRAVVWHWVSEERAQGIWLDRRTFETAHQAGRHERATLPRVGLVRRAAEIVRRLGRGGVRFAWARLWRSPEVAAFARNDLALCAGWWSGVLHLPRPEPYRTVTSEDHR